MLLESSPIVDSAQIRQNAASLEFPRNVTAALGEPMPQDARMADWTEQFRRRGPLRNLTLSDVAMMSTDRQMDGWYVVKCGDKWAIGRKSGDQHYPIVVSGKAVMFESMAKAAKYLRALLMPTRSEGGGGKRLKLRIEVAPPG